MSPCIVEVRLEVLLFFLQAMVKNRIRTEAKREILVEEDITDRFFGLRE